VAHSVSKDEDTIPDALPHHLPIICLGLLALKSGVQEDVWTVLSFL